MYKIVLSYLLVLWFCLSIKAQERDILQIKGIVTDVVNQPIKGVHCYLKNNDHFGSVTDSLGYFQIAASNSTVHDTLILSTLGYERKEIPIALINQGTDTTTFQLKQQSIFLDEISVETEGYDLKSLYLKALAHIPKNYPNIKHQLKGLYRVISTEGSKYTKLEEAAITIDDPGYKRPADEIKISTQQFRESKEWGKVDPFHVKTWDKVHTKISERIGNSPNPLNRAYKMNFIRVYNHQNGYFNLETMQKYIDDYYRFELINIEVINGDTIYQIAFAEGVTPPVPRPTGLSYIKVNMTDMAIIETQFTRRINQMEQHNVHFQKIDGKYYPHFIKTTMYRMINQEFFDDEYDIHYFYFDDVNTGKFRKIKFKDSNDHSEIYSYTRADLDTAFWENTPLIEKHPLNPAVKIDLEKHQPLDIQFKAAANNKNQMIDETK